MLPNKLSPSVMCIDWLNLKETLKTFEEEKIDYLHIDIMDGNFVPNYSLGTDFVKSLRNSCNIPMDIHLMITNPETKLNWFDIRENDYVMIHYESTNHVQRALAKIASKGAKPGIALNPATPINVLENILPDIDCVLIMTVNPGYAGQNLIPQTIEKIRKTRIFLDNNGFENVEIEVDGNVSFKNTVLMHNAGANIFVAGSSSIFYDRNNIKSGIKQFREILLQTS